MYTENENHMTIINESENLQNEDIIDKPVSEYDAEDWYLKYNKPDIMDRLKVHLIDTASIYIIYSLIYYLLIPGTVFNTANFIILYLFFVYINAANFVTWIELYLTNGYTLGKFIYKHRVVKLNGEKLTIKDVFIRSFLIKGFCDTASCGIMNIVSIILAYARENNRTAHDIAAYTVTVDVKEYKEKTEKRVEFK